MTHKQKILLMLMDGEWHRLDEFVGWLYRDMDPIMATRRYLRAFQRPDRNGQTGPRMADPTLAYQISKGRDRMLQTVILHAVKEGTIEVQWDVTNRFRGNTMLRLAGPLSRKNSIGGIVLGLRELLREGKVKSLKVELDPELLTMPVEMEVDVV